MRLRPSARPEGDGREARMSEVLYEERGAVAVLTLNRPQALNSFQQGLRLAIIETVRHAQESGSVRAIVLTGAGRGFSAGADLTAEMPTPSEVAHQLEHEYKVGILALAEGFKPVIAAVHGFAAGIGLGYVLACDLVVMGAGAFMQVPFARIGLVPDGGLCWQLVQRLGHNRAFEFAIESERIPAQRCLELGLANRVVADEEVLAQACAWAERLAAAAPLAVGHTKRLLRAAAGATLEETMRLEAQAQMRCVASADFREGSAAFFEKRAARFAGK